jgi:hypothetical protein
MYPDKKYVFGGLDSVPTYTAKTSQQLLAEFRFLANWLPYSLDLNPLDFDTRAHFAGKSPGYASNLASLCPSIAVV